MLVSVTRRSAAAVLAAALLSACTLGGGGGESAPAKPAPDGPLPAVAWDDVEPADLKDGGTLRLGVGVLPRNFNPQHSTNADTEIDRLLGPTNGSAIRLTDDGGWEVDPDYARSVEVVDRSPLTVRVALNPQAVWERGNPITARDMIAYWKAQNGSSRDFEVRSTEGFDDIASVTQGRTRFDYTVTFDTPTTDWPRYVYPALPAIVSSKPRLFNAYFVDRPISSNGPFRVASIDRDRGRVELERNPRWWGEKPRLDAITFQAATPDVQLEALDADELDVVEVPPSQRGKPLAAVDDSVDVQVSAGTEWTQLTLNGGRAPLDDVRVRRAIAAALDREALADLVTQPVDAPTEVLGSYTFVPGQRGYVDQSDLLKHDPAAAEKLLAQAGWKPGPDGIRRKGKSVLRLDMPVPESTSSNAERAELVAAQLKTVGIEVRIQKVPDDTFFTDRIIPLSFDLATFTHQGSAFPIVESRSRYFPLDAPQNFTGTADRQLGVAWIKALRALDDAERKRVVQILDKRLFRDVPVVPFAVTPEVVAVRDDVRGIGASQFRQPVWTRVGFAAPATD